MEKAELEKAKSGDPEALRHVLDALVLKQTTGYFDVVSAINIYKAALKSNPDIVKHHKITPILYLIPILDMASQAGNLDVSAVADGFSFDSPFHAGMLYSGPLDGQFTSVPPEKMYAACAYMAERASVSNDLGIRDPKLIFQLVFRFFIIPLTNTMGIESWESYHKEAINVITKHYKAWKSNTIMPFFPDQYLMPVFGARWIAPAIDSKRQVALCKTITQNILDQIRYLPSNVYPLCQKAYQTALVFFKGQACAENTAGLGEGEFPEEFTKQILSFYDDFCQKIEPLHNQSRGQDDTEWPFYTPEQKKIVNPVQRHQFIKQKLSEAEKAMHQLFKNILDARKKSTKPWIGSVSALHTVQMRFLAFSNALGFLYGEMYKNPKNPDSGAIIAHQVRLNMVQQRLTQLLKLYYFLKE